MITPETVIAAAIKSPLVMDQLGEALRSDLVTANPFFRRIAEFADDFLSQRRKLPSTGDYEVWLLSLEEGMLRDGTKEALGRLLAIDISGYDPSFFAGQIIDDLQRAAAQTARARLNASPAADPAALAALAEKVASIKTSGLQGLARLSDIGIWANPVAEDEYVSTGFPTLNSIIRGWGKELWIAFADSKMGKSILLQNFGSNLAVRGKNVLHITLELGLRPQIHRYYRQIAEMNQAEFNSAPERLRERLSQWFRLAQGTVYLMQLAPYSLDADGLKRLIERVNRRLADETGNPSAQVDVLVLDYLDLMTAKVRGNRGGGASAYEDLGHITHDTRGLCPIFDLTVLTVSQAVRKPAKAGRLTMQDMGDSYNKVRAADGLLSLVQTPEEAQVFQGRLGIVNARDSGGRGEEIPVYINRDLSLIQELDHPNTIQLMRRLGQLPAQGAAVPAQPGGFGVRS